MTKVKLSLMPVLLAAPCTCIAGRAGELTVPADAAPGEAVLRATSPSVDPRMLPPQADAPLLVLDDLPRTGGTRIAGGAVEGG